MKKYIPLVILLSLLSTTTFAQKDTILSRIVLIGDGGALKNGKQPVVEAIRKTIPMDTKTTVVFLGDNLYGDGLPDDQYPQYGEAREILDSQLSVADNTPSRVFMIPGNHDWENGGRGGFEAILRQQLYVDQLGKANVKFYPEDGCPGPIEVPIGNDVVMVIYDSQWWLHPYDKPEIESDCPSKTKEEMLAQLEDIILRNTKKLLIIAGHHPFKSNGVHGGLFTWKQHIFPFTDIRKSLYVPLPIIGSIYPIARSVFGTPQDLKHPNYVNMINQITNTVKPHPNVIFVAGHEHGLQWIKDSTINYIVSGSGCKTTRVSKTKRSPYVADSLGFAVLEVNSQKTVSINFYTVADSSVFHSFRDSVLNFSKIPEEKIDSSKRVVETKNVQYKDTFTISASDKYQPVEGRTKWLMGENYRKEWSAPVNMKVFHINTVKGGLIPLSLGGGKQTKSLRLKDKSGKEYILRAVDKNPTQALPANFRGTFAQDLVQEFNSASHPYGGLAIPGLAKPLNIIVPKPELYFVPDDPALGFYQTTFANTVALLEERHASIDGSDTRSTAKTFNKFLEENDHRADQPAVLRARLLDILVGDFDRHFDQWRWATNDTGKGKIYYPIPRDRDQAFFYSDGALMKVASSKLLPFLRGFRHDIPEVEWLGHSSKDFDRVFMNDLDRDEWKKEITNLQEKLTDTVIAKAALDLPKEIYAIGGDELRRKLISRRNEMMNAGMKYYRFISRQVNVVGSNRKEYFKVTNHDDGLHVRVYAREAGNDTSFIMYDRTFDPSTTYEIRLYGLNDDDLFDIDESADSRIKMRIIGGKGNDTFDIRGNVRNLLYDLKVEGNYIKNTRRTKNRFSTDPPVNYYSILGYQYNYTRFPQVEFGYNSDDGLVIGGAFIRRTHGFRNEPYATDQRFSTLYSLTRGAWSARYLGEFNHITRDADLILMGKFLYPVVSNFFGLGNTTVKEEDLPYGYYRSRYRLLELNALIRKRYFERLHVSVGPYFMQYWNRYKDNSERILGKPTLVGLDSADVYSQKSYLGARAFVKFDNRNSEIFPTRGILWNNELLYTAGLNTVSNNFSKITTDMTIHASLTDPARLIAIVGLGGGKIFNRDFEFFQGLDLGNGNLHGFRKNRYVGQSSAYASLELRYKLFDIKSYLMPGPFGITGFYDIGRVWMKTESSRKWHGAYGGGIYFLPFNLFMVSASVGFTPNEKLFNFVLGSKINLTF